MEKGRRILFIIILFFEIMALAVIAAFFVVAQSATPYLFAAGAPGANGDLANLPNVNAIIIPGAGVFTNGNLSPVLQDRVDVAIRLYRLGKAEKILVSGDNSTLSHNEVNPMNNYLLKNGIPAQDIFLDHAGFDTYSTMYRAHAIFGVSSTIIVSQWFHLPRSVYVARNLGMNAYGFDADNGSYLFSNYSHEWFSDVKAIFDVVTHRQPKYLGPLIPITGDGTQTQ